jgi:hypothetical protein
MVVFPQPKIEIATGIEAGDGLAKKALEPSQKLVDLGKLFARVGEKIIDVELRVILANENS